MTFMATRHPDPTSGCPTVGMAVKPGRAVADATRRNSARSTYLIPLAMRLLGTWMMGCRTKLEITAVEDLSKDEEIWIAR